ncbi:uncharacterized protein (TIGR00369 family) [Mumia flava]|uniref:Uncharacterized protein (TIGR00369 family) n=1 Tax=Mumia flava TaxID=1348852 RepID=A0A2M9BIT2_9ACTN|nr:PaaI family thioesterase [Mumia flava]PJJ57847.1 uncharacterized protein (TIGR00369 family) [Mumia flava]
MNAEHSTASQEKTLDALLGFEWVEVTPDRVRVEWDVDTRHLQPFGIVHGGVHCAAHETAASVAAQAWLGERGIVVGVNNSTDFLRQARPGDRLTTIAAPIHRGRASQLWRLETTNADGKLVAQGQVRLAHLDGAVPPEFLQFVRDRQG